MGAPLSAVSSRLDIHLDYTVQLNGSLLLSLLVLIVHVAIERTKVYRSSGGSPDNDATPIKPILLTHDEVGYCEPIQCSCDGRLRDIQICGQAANCVFRLRFEIDLQKDSQLPSSEIGCVAPYCSDHRAHEGVQ